MRALLGLASYHRSFIPHFMKVTAPLKDVLKGNGNSPVKWDKLHLEAFQKTKRALCHDVALKPPDFMRPFILQTNASNKAMGAMLSQETDGIDRPIAYASSKLNLHLQRYVTIERVCLAIKWRVEYFRYYLLGQEFTLITDHTPLKWLKWLKTTD